MPDRMERTVKYAPWFGFAGTSLILLGSVVTALAYRGISGEVYSPLNHFISELGDVGVSVLAPVFNSFLIAGAVCLAVFLAALSRHMRGFPGRLFLVLGLVTGLSAAMVGVFPMNHLGPHVIAAMTFFYSAMAATVFFSLWNLFSSDSRCGKWISFAGILPVACLVGFLFLTKPLGTAGHGLGLPTDFHRPDVWPRPLMEWTVLISVLAWVVSVSASLVHGRDRA